MFKKCSLLFVSLLLLSIVAACGAPPVATQSSTAVAATAATSAPTAAEAAPTEAIEETAAAAETMMPMETETTASETAMSETATIASETATTTGSTSGKPLKIGMVTDIGKLGDKSFNDSAWAGVQMGAEAVGGESKVIETTDPNDYERNIGQFVAEQYDVIVTVGFGLGEQTIVAAQANPNIHFIGVDQFQAETLPNLTGLIFEEDKAGFLIGALAALYTKTNKIGAVVATDAVPPVWRFGEGYRAGALYAKSDVDVQVVYHNDVGFDKTFSDPEWGKATALSMLDQDVDVIFGGGGSTGNGALIGVAERASTGAAAIGVDADQYYTVPEAQAALMTSAIKVIDEGVSGLIQQVAAGTIEGGNSLGKVGIAPYHDFDSKVPADVKAKIDEIRTQLEDGTLQTNVAAAKPS